MKALKYIEDIHKVNVNQRRQPVEIPNTDREYLAQMLGELGFNKGVEVGVEEGIYSEVLCKANPNIELFGVDAWTPYKGYRDHVTQKKLDGLHERAMKRLAPYNCTLIKEFSVKASEMFDDESLDFVYIDANHEFQHVVNDLSAWERKVKVGGIVAGHDYIKRKTNAYLMHVIPAIHGYCEAYQIKPLFVLGRKHPKDKSERRDDTRSWFYVKPPRDLTKYNM